MSSGQWEVVGKSKKSQNGKVKTKGDEKQALKNGPKLEDVVPHSQLKSLYAGMEIDVEKKPKEKKKDGEKKGKKQEKRVEPPKPKIPKNIEGALEAIDITELASIITSNKVRFSNAPLVWLKEIATFLNSKIPIEVDDPTFAIYPPTYPLSEAPAELRNALTTVLQDAGNANVQLFFDGTLTALANDMSRGLQVNGHRLLLQLMAHENPELCVSSVQKYSSLRNSYQNRPPIGLSLLWAIGQGGLKDFSVGLKVWQEIFLPVIELKNYTKYVVGYLSKMVEQHTEMDTIKASQEQFFAMIDLINTKRNGLSKEFSSDLINQLSKYKDIYFKKSGNKLQVTFNQLMKKLPNQYLSGAALDTLNRIIVESLVECLSRDDSTNATWRQLFHRCSKPSATLLDYIDSNWSEVSPKLKLKSLKTTVLQYQEVSGEHLKGKKKDEILTKTTKICQDILDRMTSSRRNPWLWASFVLLLSIIGLVAYDVSLAGGNFPKSTTGKLFKDLGILEHSQKAWQKTLSTSARGYLWLETNTPVYYTQTVEICSPYAQLSKDLFYVGLKKAGVLYGNIQDYVVEKTPVVVKTIEEYAPGLVDNVQNYASGAWNGLKKYSGDYYQITTDYLATKVFVGEWAPEILQNKTQSALNVTRSHMSSYYVWFRQQVHLYSQIP